MDAGAVVVPADGAVTVTTAGAGICGRWGDGTGKADPRRATGRASAGPAGAGLAGAGGGAPASAVLGAGAEAGAVHRRPGVAWAAALAALNAGPGALAGCGSGCRTGGISVVASGAGNAATSRDAAAGLPGSVPAAVVVVATRIQSARVR